MVFPVLCLLFLAALFPSLSNAQELIRKGEKIGIEKAIEIALKNHPAIIAARNTVDVSRSRVGEAKANYYPQVGFAAGYSRVNPASQSSSHISAGSYNDYSGTFTATQNIYDFGRTSSQVGIQSLTLDSARSDLENTTEQVVLGVKQTYYALLQAGRNKAVAQETVNQFQKHLDQARGFYEVGTASKYDVTKAEVDLSNAKLNLIRADNAVRIAKVNFDNAMGVPGVPEYSIEDILSYQPYEISFEEAVKKAYANRPDLQSIIAKKNATEQSIRLAKAQYYPYLTGNANYGWTGESFPLDSGWAAGATLNFPLFSGFLYKYQIEEAKANFGVLSANETSLRQTILLDVQQAFLNMREARERISAAELTVRQATENLDIANGRYAAGVGNPIEVTDALVNYSNAKTSYNQALYDYKVAQASLDKAMGVRYGMK
ncbi:MAG: TolC family protein [Syntrophales bacterium]